MSGHLYTSARSAERAEAALSFKSLLLFALALRIAAHFALPQTPAGEALVIFTRAATIAAGHPSAVIPALQAAPAIGYPLFLAPFFALFGPSAAVVFVANLLLAAISTLLIRAVARACGLSNFGQQLAMLGYAAWLPGIWNCTMLAPENLLTPLLLAVTWLAVELGGETGAPLPRSRELYYGAGSGLAWGAAWLTASSALPLIAAPLLALGLNGRWRLRTITPPLLALGAAAAIVLAPWAVTTRNPVAAPGSATQLVARLSSGNRSAVPDGRMEAAAPGDLLTHPVRAAEGVGRGMVLFWWPNLPDRADFTRSGAIALVRAGEVTQYLLLVMLGLAAITTGPIEGRRRAVLAVVIAGCWGLHGGAYLIQRYRDPVMPLLIVLAASVLAEFLQRRMRSITGDQFEHAL